MPSPLVELTLKPKAHYGEVVPLELLRVTEPIDSVVALGTLAPLNLRNKRLTFTGEFCVDRIQNSYRWGQQITFNLWTEKLPLVETRPAKASSKYSRIAIPLSYEVARELAKGLSRLLG